VERKLDETMLVIADAKKSIAIAGIMGGEESGIDEKTNEIILEAANFNAMSVRKTAQKLGLRSEASNRFEKDLDVNLASMGMARALELIKKLCPEVEILDLVDADFAKEKKVVIKVEHEFLEKRIGQELDTKDVINILEKLGFEVKCQSVKVSSVKESIYTIEVPSWRATGDIKIPEDIVEEVARVMGYDNLAEQKTMVELEKPKIQMEHILENRVKKFLALAGGFSEVFNYP
jgi:phenylalanyl-tRNA synthetase beta chain